MRNRAHRHRSRLGVCGTSSSNPLSSSGESANSRSQHVAEGTLLLPDNGQGFIAKHPKRMALAPVDLLAGATGAEKRAPRRGIDSQSAKTTESGGSRT
jgi:hypothetical protein